MKLPAELATYILLFSSATLKTEMRCSSETSDEFQQTTWHYIQADTDSS
jgi:hypothetical protein